MEYGIAYGHAVGGILRQSAIGITNPLLPPFFGAREDDVRFFGGRTSIAQIPRVRCWREVEEKRR